MLVAASLAPSIVFGQTPDTARAAAKQNPSYRNRLLGAYDEQTGQPLAGVEVLDVTTGWRSLTSATGNVSLVYLPDGGSLVRLRKVGYAPLTLFVAISPRDTAPLTLLLRPQVGVQVLPGMTTEETAISRSLRGFDERQRAGAGGHFITDSTLRANEGKVMSSLLQRLPGATLKGGRLVSTRTPNQGPVLSGRGPGLNCAVAVYVDGVLSATTPNFERETTDTYAGVEFYASNTTAPIWISSINSQCGVLLLWTRQR